MRFVHEPAPQGRAATTLWLMLPGAYMKPADFVAAGFIEALRARGLPHDAALLEADIAQVADGSALAFLQDFLRVQPPGQTIRLLGISLGAHLALACLARADADAQQRAAAQRVRGACLLAPYLGPREIAAGIAAAGSLAQWEAPVTDKEDIDIRIWGWLKRQNPQTSGLHLGYGADDRFARSHALMAQALPPAQVDVQPGGHVWPVWTSLWNRYLDLDHEHAN